MRYIRVIVTTTANEATLMVVFTNPQYPEYQLVNKTDKMIEVSQAEDESLMRKVIGSLNVVGLF